MIRRSTLLFLTCLTALGTPTLRAKSVIAAVDFQQPSSQFFSQNSLSESSAIPQMLVAQASGGSLAGKLDVNARGEAVRALQLRLQQSGFYNGAVDGLYGLDTQRAVRAFQASVNLEETGSLDDETWQKLQGLATEQAAGETDTATSPSPETAPIASELPAAEEGVDAGDKGETSAKSGGIGKVFGLSLGLAAVLASFGIGFFIANRNKSDRSDGDEWGELETNSDLPGKSQPFQFASGTHQANTVEPLIPGLNPQNGRSSVIGNDSGNGATREVGTISPMTSSLRNGQVGGQMSGQMGGTSPLAPVDIIEGLIGDLRNPDPTRRRKAIWELGQRGSSLAMQPLVDSMIDADSKEKSLVLAALSEIGIRSLKPMSKALAIALQDDNPEVRKNAIRDLTRVYDLVVQISQMLGHATEDEDPEVRQTATWALDQLSRIRRTQDLDANVRSFSTGNTAAPIDLLSSEASLRRSQQGL